MMKLVLAITLLSAGVSFVCAAATERILCDGPINSFTVCGHGTSMELAMPGTDPADPSVLEIEDFVPGTRIDTRVLLSTGSDVKGWSFRVEHDSNVLALTESSVTTRGTRVDPSREGGFESIEIFDGSYRVVIALSFTQTELSREFDREPICSASYTLAADPGSTGTAIRIEAARLTRNARLVIPEKVFDGLVRGRPSRPSFLRGDIDADGAVRLTDPIRLLGVLLGGRDSAFDCAAVLDIDADGEVNLTDAVFLLGWLFSRGTSPAAPFPVCGPAPDEGLECRESSPGCG